VASSILIFAVGFGVLGLSALLALALARAAANADAQSERELAEHVPEILVTLGPGRAGRAPSTARVSYAGVAGLAAAQETISREPSIVLPSSRSSVGTMRLPVRRSTS
jgi:hypothetical protein